jgi:multicomponent K+:H+ antiporter subunit D
VGRPFPASTTLLGFAFLGCALLVAGFPPLPTFLGKAGMLSAALAPVAAGGARAAVFAGVLLGSGLLALVALTRTGVRIFWSGGQRQPPLVRAAEGVPVVALLALCGVLTVAAGPTMALAEVAARSLHDRREYVDAVLGANRVASPPPKGVPDEGR